jgi:hypothetical protein
MHFTPFTERQFMHTICSALFNIHPLQQAVINHIYMLYFSIKQNIAL